MAVKRHPRNKSRVAAFFVVAWNEVLQVVRPVDTSGWYLHEFIWN